MFQLVFAHGDPNIGALCWKYVHVVHLPGSGLTTSQSVTWQDNDPNSGLILLDLISPGHGLRVVFVVTIPASRRCHIK